MIARLTCRLARRCRNQRPPRPGSLPVIGIRCLVPGQNQLCRIAASAPQTRYVSERRFRRPGVSWQHHPCVEGAIIVISGLGMPPPGVRVLVATRPVDFRRGAPTQCKIRVFHSVDVFRLLLWLSHNREPPPRQFGLANYATTKNYAEIVLCSWAPCAPVGLVPKAIGRSRSRVPDLDQPISQRRISSRVG